MAAKASLFSATVLVFVFVFVLFYFTVQTTAAASEPKNAFDFIKQLEGSHRGQIIHGINELKKYLNNFGYLDNLPRRVNDRFDDALESAIKAYQRNFHLKPTGILDGDTVKQMIRPRCGVADIEILKRTPQLPSSKTHLTYRFNPETLPKNAKSIFALAFQRWAEVTDFTFEEINDQENSVVPDFDIEFLRGDHGDGIPFDGYGGVFGHVNRFSGKTLQIHLDEDEKWSVDLNPRREEIDLESVVVHEIGHLLGLDHNTENPDSIMYPCIDNGVAKRDLHKDDITKIRAIYGLK